MADPAISVRGLRYAYGSKLAVDDVSFDVAPGEIVGFLGPNGAGKSTTLKMLTGQLVPSAGELRLLGLDGTRDRARIQPEVGVAFEEKNLYAELSGAENLRFFANLFGIARPDIDGLLARVGLADRGHDRVADYSKGMRQRLMVARAIVNEPKLLFLDEPTDGLDPVSAKSLRELIRAEAARGAAVLLTTHDMHEADELSDRVAFINAGKLIALDTPENLKQAHGRRSVKVRTKNKGNTEETTIALDAADTGPRVAEALAQPGLLSVHTEEATLEEIFIKLAGRGLA